MRDRRWRRLGAMATALLLGTAAAALAADESPRRGGELLFIMPAPDPPSYDAHREDTFAVIQPAAPHHLNHQLDTVWLAE